MNQTDKPTGVPEDEFEMPKEVWDRFVKKYPSFDYDDDAPEPHQDYCAKLGYKFALPELTAKEEEIAKLKEEVESLKEQLAISSEQLPKYSLPDKPFQYGM